MPNDSPSQTSIFDASALVSRFAGSTEYCRQLVDRFIQEIPQRLESFEKAVERGEISEIRDVAHKFKGVALTLSALAMGVICQEIEDTESSAECARLLEKLRQEARRFIEEASAWCSQTE